MKIYVSAFNLQIFSQQPIEYRTCLQGVSAVSKEQVVGMKRIKGEL